MTLRVPVVVLPRADLERLVQLASWNAAGADRALIERAEAALEVRDRPAPPSPFTVVPEES